MQIPIKLFYQYMVIFFNFPPTYKKLIIFIHYKSGIATAIRGL